jgi:predicted GIY-YIG superfamily endonuclease
MANFFYVYILVSEIDETIHYTGITKDLAVRLKDHNQGNCIHTRKYRPWRIETIGRVSILRQSEGFRTVFEKRFGP